MKLAAVIVISAACSPSAPDPIHSVGMVIAAAYLVDPGVGLVTTLAVVLHEVPQEIGDFGVLVHPDSDHDHGGQ